VTSSSSQDDQPTIPDLQIGARIGLPGPDGKPGHVSIPEADLQRGITLGRQVPGESSPDLPLDDPTVSRQHAHIQRGEDGRIRVVDLGSRNGTTIVEGDQRWQLTPHQSYVLGERQSLELGRSPVSLHDLQPQKPPSLPLEPISHPQSPAPATTEQVREAMRAVPPHLQQRLADEGWKVYGVRSMADIVDPRLANQTPRGYQPGSTYDDVPAMADPSKQEIYISDRSRRDGRVAGDINHEIGHALDASLGISGSPEFEQVYRLDAGEVDTFIGIQRPVDYYLQEYGAHGSSSGQQEAVAQGIGAILHGDPNSQYYQDFQARFPNVISYLEERLRKP
jgi:hypothetical protein